MTRLIHSGSIEQDKPTTTDAKVAAHSYLGDPELGGDFCKVADMRPYLRDASAAVAPLHIVRGVQTKIFEAMAMGLPVAASRKAAMALWESLLPEVHAEDDPQRLTEFLIETLRQSAPSPCAETRRAVAEYFECIPWAEQMENILLQTVSSWNQEQQKFHTQWDGRRFRLFRCR